MGLNLQGAGQDHQLLTQDVEVPFQREIAGSPAQSVTSPAVISEDSGSNSIRFEAQNNPSNIPDYFLNAVLNSNDGTCGGGTRRDLG